MSGLAELASAAAAAQDARPGVALALATLVRVEGSSYRQPGARLLVDAEHRVLGGAISGGCLEGDVAARAEEVCARGCAMELTYDLRDDLQAIWGFGSACDGLAHILLEPLADAAWLAQAAQIRLARTGGAVVTAVAEHGGGGTVALFAGSRWVPTRAGDAWSSGDGDIAALAAQVQRTGRPVFEAVRLRGKPLPCFIEPLVPPVSLQLVGAGRGAEAFARIATTLGWDVTIFDHRDALLDALVLPAGVRTVAARADMGAAHMTRDSRTAIALLSHMFEVDIEWLTAIIPQECGYIGVLGSRQRAARLLETLTERGVVISPQVRERLFAPIGLDLGGETPESIALASIAEIEAVMHSRPGGALRDRETPIHTRTPTPG